jgi:transcription elongation factor Elf1
VNRGTAYYTHPCRCSHELVVTEADLENGVDLIDCTGCGERIAIGYELASEPNQT